MNTGRDTATTTASGHTAAILASRVTGTKVCDQAGNDVGEVEDIVLDKTTDNIMFAVVSFGGFLGIGEKYHAVPWKELDYDPTTSRYRISWTRAQLESAPADSLDELTRNGGTAYRERAFDYYHTPRYW